MTVRQRGQRPRRPALLLSVLNDCSHEEHFTTMAIGCLVTVFVLGILDASTAFAWTASFCLWLSSLSKMWAAGCLSDSANQK